MAYRNLREWLWAPLLPLSYAWAFGSAAKRKRVARAERFRSRHPVWCIGNVHSGGSGKTPLVMAIAEKFAARHPVVLSRGYGGELSDAGGRVDPTRVAEGPALYGDEPFLIARRTGCPVLVGRDRAALARSLEDEPRALILLDDGFQHFALARDLDLVVVNTGYSLADSFCLPLGDLREPLSALADAGAIVLNASGTETATAAWSAWLAQECPQVPVFVVRPRSAGIFDGETATPVPAGPIAAFCGIADPERFTRAVGETMKPVWVRHFADHHAYSDEDAAALVSGAPAGTHFVTTEKDWPKAHPLFERRGARLSSLRIQYEIPDEFWYFLEARLETK